jgi:hypothetical protein
LRTGLELIEAEIQAVDGAGAAGGFVPGEGQLALRLDSKFALIDSRRRLVQNVAAVELSRQPQKYVT